MGFGEDESIQAAAGTVQDGKTLSVLEGAQAAMKSLTTPKKPSKKKDALEAPEVVNFDDRARDYRRAIQAAHLNRSDILTEMKEFGFAPELEELFDI
jgi:hypothetical protein